ncbi:hypothetical protein DFS33DRAFT_1496070 [Desarmillaria ectypa]|nr:hypothetical protein DFS33DRAFT_1496070 [Desarmillaria ectypa]
MPDFEDPENVDRYIQDRHVIGYDPLVQPALLRHEIVASSSSRKTIASTRHAAAQRRLLFIRIIGGHSDHLLIVVGPCSIHCPEQAIDYARLLKEHIPNWPNLLIVMRAYLYALPKPRTTVGWKGLINDPDLDGSFRINKGLRIARQLLCDITNMGVPVATELLDTISLQYIGDMLAWGTIGARTTESQLHRELASGVSFPIGFKNGTNGCVTIAVDAMKSASNPHAFMGVTEQGLASIVKTSGNRDVHIILRGGNKGPNYSSEHVQAAVKQMGSSRKWPSIMIDCSHGNSQKNHNNQPLVVKDICEQLRSGSRHITGVMIESHINEGRQDVPEGGPGELKYGVSITDACISWKSTVVMLNQLNEAVQQRRDAVIEAGLVKSWGYERSRTR